MKILTDEEIAEISVECALNGPSDIDFARALEAKIMERIGEPVAWCNKKNTRAVIRSVGGTMHTGDWTPLFAIKGVNDETGTPSVTKD